jgi:ankyrin repeat protein
MLHVCAQNNLKKMAHLCIKHGCDVNARNKKGMTPLDYCDMLQFQAMAEWLVVMGAENGAYTENKSQNNFASARSMR